MCKFIHLCKTDQSGRISCKGGITIAYDKIGKGSYLVAVAKCHEKDNFNKKIGRVKAEGRLKSEKQSYLLESGSSEKDFVKQLIQQYTPQVVLQ